MGVDLLLAVATDAAAEHALGAGTLGNRNRPRATRSTALPSEQETLLHRLVAKHIDNPRANRNSFCIEYVLDEILQLRLGEVFLEGVALGAKPSRKGRPGGGILP